jgi:hypothetical protein
MADHEWCTLHFKGDSPMSEYSVQRPAVHADQMPETLLAANQSCHESIRYDRFEREAEVHDHFHCCLRFYKHSGMLVNWPQLKLTTIFFMQYSVFLNNSFNLASLTPESI